MTLPTEEYAASWDVVIDAGAEAAETAPREAGSALELTGRSVVVLREHRDVETTPDSSVAASLAAQAG